MTQPAKSGSADPIVRVCDVGLRACAVAAVWQSGFDIANGSVVLGLVMLLLAAIAWEAARS